MIGIRTTLAPMAAIGAAIIAVTGMIAPSVSAQTVPVQAAQAAAKTSPSAEDILQMESERYRRLTVPVTIKGEGPFQFLIDTGAQATVLSRDLADRLELFDRRTATLIGMASSKEVETTSVPDFSLGSRNFTIPTSPIVEGANIGSADGILGLDSLQDQRVLLDFDASTIAVADADSLGGNDGYDIVVRARAKFGQLIITKAKLDGVSVSVIVDTGAQGSIGNPALLKRLRRARSFGVAEMSDVNGASMSGDVKLGKALSFGRAKLANFPIAFADSPTFSALGLDDKPALVLGMAELKLFKRVAIDFKSRRILFELPRGARVPTSTYFRSYGH